MLPGKGVSATVNGKRICAGNQSLLDKKSIVIDKKIEQLIQQNVQKGATITYVTIDHVFAGVIVLSDALRSDSKQVISRLNQLGVVPVLLTGDHTAVANQIAEEAGIKEVYASCLPEDKLKTIDHYQRNNELVCMIGDGINDAPALKKATVGIAMGGIGSDIAVDAADVALVNDEVKELPHLFALARVCLKTITDYTICTK